jgi:hypothetical protein
MTRRSRAVGALIAACALGAPAAAAADATTPAATTQLAGSAAPATTTATAVGAVAPSQKLHVELWLTPDISGATRELATPGDRGRRGRRAANVHRSCPPGYLVSKRAK